jgi:hypothetical protein
VDSASVHGSGDGFVIDELIDLEISALRGDSVGDGTQVFKDARGTAQRFLGGQVSDPLVESQMIDYVTQWMVEQGKVKTPQDVVRLLAQVDEFTARSGGKGQRLLMRAYSEAMRHRNLSDRVG